MPMAVDATEDSGAAPGTRFRYRAPIDGSWSDWGLTPAADDFDAALQEALSPIQHGRFVTAAFIERDEETGGDFVDLYLTQPYCVLVTGHWPLAERVRAALRDGRIGGWRLHRLPDNQTSIQVLEPQLRGRYYNLLRRNAISTVEEAAAIPDAGWLELRNVGPAFMRALKKALADHGARDDVAHAADPTDLDARREHVEGQLHPAALARYGDFSDLLIRSRIPLTAIDKIAESLNAEPVPAADPMTMLLLETAGEPQPLDLYRRRHADPQEPYAATGGEAWSPVPSARWQGMAPSADRCNSEALAPSSGASAASYALSRAIPPRTATSEAIRSCR